MKKLKPVLAGEWKLIGTNPDLGPYGKEKQQCVDHHIFKADDGLWHLWGCIRHTKFGRLLYHWKSSELYKESWEMTGEIIFTSRLAGESLDATGHEEWIQSPFFVKENGLYYMFYGGHATGLDFNGNPIAFEKLTADTCNTISQISLMTSNDGLKWERRKDERGFSRIFTGPGEARDPCLIKTGDTWRIYYSGNHYEGDKKSVAVYTRTSKDLINWSDYTIAAQDSRLGVVRWSFECPHVVERGGYYYLFLTQKYTEKVTSVYRSADPANFGIGDAAKDYFIGMIEVGAPEIIIDDNGSEYITSNHDLHGGTNICPLKWVEE